MAPKEVSQGVLLLTIWFPYLLVVVSHTWIGIAKSIFAPFKGVHIGSIYQYGALWIQYAFTAR